VHIRDYLAALEYVNEQRGELGLPELDHLPAGIPGNPLRCPISRALPGALLNVGVNVVSAQKLPSKGVFRFVEAFDQKSNTRPVDPGSLVDGGIEDDKGCLVPA